jgi:serine/threonine-protein kinase
MESIGKYQIVEKIGVGGFGVVFKAIDPFIKRNVAIKTCTAEDAETRERFVREAEIGGNLQHRNIVTIFEFGYHEQVPYLVQEYLSGEDLDRKIKRKDFLTIPEKILYLVQIARGLAYAHGRGIVHRDVKPANIRILEDDTAKIMDFGIAKLAQQQSTLTQVGMTLGTAAYLAPEQIRGEPIDQRTDIFSFGVLAYELLTYDRPFQDAQISTVFYKILNTQPPPVRSREATCPPELERIIERCLAKRREDRYPTTAEMLRELESLMRAKKSRESAESVAPAPAASSTESTSARTQVVPAIPTAQQATRKMPLAEMELDTPHGTPAPQSHSLATMHFGRGRRHGWLGFAAGLAVALAIGLGGLWLAREQGWLGNAARSASSPPATTAPATTAPNRPAATQPSSPPPVVATPVKPALPAGPSTPPSVDKPAAPAPAPVPEKPKPAVLRLAAAWNPEMTVRVGGELVKLDHDRRIELPAGTYTLQYSLETPNFSDGRDVRVTLSPGEERRVDAPIRAPGVLTVQSHLNTRPGYVRLDGNFLGSTPLRARFLPPGPHQLELFASPDTSQPAAIRRTVDVASDIETVFTFDIDGQVENRETRRPLIGGN